MFIPIYDDNKLKSIEFQYMTIAIIAVNVMVYIMFPSTTDAGIIASFALVPGELLSSLGLALPTSPGTGTLSVPESYTLLSYMFFHADPLHLIGNMLFLWVFGDNVEDAIGHFKFLFFYLLCGVFAGMVHILMVTQSGIVGDSAIPLIGASGAVSGVVAAYLMLHPKVRLWVLALPIFPLRVSAAFALGLWIIYQFVMAWTATGSPIAWWAHIGGLFAGAVLILVMRRPGVKLFE